MRLIDADALKDYYLDLLEIKSHGYGASGVMITVRIGHVIHMIEKAPSIDLVRCKECKWAEFNERDGVYKCKCHIPTFTVLADGFCSNGERNENK